jgi:hypothetical protein
LTRAQENAHDKGQAGYDKERDPFRRERTPLRQSLPRYFQIHARIMAQPGLSIHRGIFYRRPSKICLALAPSPVMTVFGHHQRSNLDFGEGKAGGPNARFSRRPWELFDLCGVTGSREGISSVTNRSQTV